MYNQELKSDSGELKTELMHIFGAYAEFHQVLVYLLQSQHLLNEAPMEMNEDIASGQRHFICAVRERSEENMKRLGELYQMAKEED
jgi:hypothetical protein